MGHFFLKQSWIVVAFPCFVSIISFLPSSLLWAVSFCLTSSHLVLSCTVLSFASGTEWRQIISLPLHSWAFYWESGVQHFVLLTNSFVMSYFFIASCVLHFFIFKEKIQMIDDLPHPSSLRPSPPLNQSPFLWLSAPCLITWNSPNSNTFFLPFLSQPLICQ